MINSPGVSLGFGWRFATWAVIFERPPAALCCHSVRGGHPSRLFNRSSLMRRVAGRSTGGTSDRPRFSALLRGPIVITRMSVSAKSSPRNQLCDPYRSAAFIERRFCFCRHRQNAGEAAIKADRQGFSAVADDRVQFDPVNQFADDLGRLPMTSVFRQSGAEVGDLRAIIISHVRMETNRRRLRSRRGGCATRLSGLRMAPSSRSASDGRVRSDLGVAFKD
jgi:hypothetical protein